MITAPNNNIELIGYKEIFLEMKNLYDKNILPNKIIFSGNRGIGKCTFVYHLINYIFSKNEDDKYNYDKNLILSNNRSYNLILNNSHPNFYLVSSNVPFLLNDMRNYLNQHISQLYHNKKIFY